MMLNNRSMPRCTVIPVLGYANVNQAVEWLCGAFCFTLRLRIGNHRAQLNVEDGGAVVITESSGSTGESSISVMVRVVDVDAHYQRAKKFGARIVQPPTTFPYGERQYSAYDFAGHSWTFSQSVADIDPTDWGGTPGEL